MGMIYKPKWKDKAGAVHESEVFWIKYYRNGKAYRESSKTTKEDDAKKLVKLREGEIAKGKIPGIYFDRIKFDELAEDFLTDYRLNNRKSMERATISTNRLKEAFSGMRVPNLTTPHIQAYIERRLSQEASHATVNRELAALKRMLYIGARQTPPKVDRVPYIPMLKENNVRKGFFEREDFLSLRDALPAYLKGFVTFAYKTGWRKSEIAGLTWSNVDLSKGTVRLEPGETKNSEGRTVYADTELKGILNAQWEARKKNQTLTPYVFSGKDGA